MNSPRRHVLTTIALAMLVVVSLAVGWQQLVDAPIPALVLAALLVIGCVFRGWPTIALTCITVGVFVASAAGQGIWPYVAIITIAYLSGRARRATRVTLLVAGAATLLLLLDALADVVAGDPIVTIVALAATVVLPWWIGVDTRVRIELRDAGWERAAWLEREQRLVIGSVRQEERTRLAADMHDSLGYELSLLALTAGAGEVNPSNTVEQREQFARTRAAAVAAVDTLHGVLRLLREDELPDEIAPGALGALIARYRDAAAPIDAGIDADIDAEQRGWSAALKRGVYRMVQELLTNAAKHAPGGSLQLRVESTEDEVTVRAHNVLSERVTAPAGSHTGLVGLSERAAALGGTMTTSQAAGAFEVLIRLPLRPRSERDGVATAPRTLTHEERHARAPKRHRRWRSALLPLAAVAVIIGILVGVNAITIENIGLTRAELNHIEIGATEEAAEAFLPPSSLDELPPVFTAPDTPTGTDCRFYRAAENWFDIGDDYIRLCIAGGHIVSKERIS